MTNDARYTGEIKPRISMAKATFKKKKKMLFFRNVTQFKEEIRKAPLEDSCLGC